MLERFAEFDGLLGLIASFVFLPALAWIKRQSNRITSTETACANNTKAIQDMEQAVDREFARRDEATKEDRHAHMETTKLLIQRLDQMDRNINRMIGHILGPNSVGK